MNVLGIPLAGDRLKNARAETSTLSSDALTYLLGMALIALNEQIDEEKVPGTKTKLLHMTECLQGPSPVVPSHVSQEAVDAAIAVLHTFLDHVPHHDRPAWDQ